MNSWRGAIVVLFKELKDILRDRRTIVSMVLVPILVYPVISIGFGTIMSSQFEKSRAAEQIILVLPANADPSMVALLHGVPRVKFAIVDSVRQGLLRRSRTDGVPDSALIDWLLNSDPALIADSLKHSVYYAAISANLAGAIVELPADLSARLAAGDSTVVRTYCDETELRSETAGDHLREWADQLRDSIVEVRLGSAGMDKRLLRPIIHEAIDVAPKRKQSGFIFAAFLPYMLVILMLTGGMYPALDITAGEKERNTLETLLVAPISRWHLAIGKFLTVLVAGLVTMALSITSMVATFKIGGMGFGDSDEALEMAKAFSLSTPTVLWILLLMIPTAVLFSSLLVAVSISARSFKEGQSYTTPLIFLAILPAMVGMVPGIELNPVLAFMPVVNICLALKSVILETHRPAMIALVFLATAIYASFALFITARLFDRESTLFRT